MSKRKTKDNIDIEDVEAKTIISKSQISTDLYAANPYIGCSHGCLYCYAVFMRRFSGHINDKWGSFVDVKNWRPLTQKQMMKYKGEWILISSTTDPYQRAVEEDRMKTHQLLTELKDSGANVSILTKSDLVLSDVALFKSFQGKIAIGFSINTIDETLKNEMDRASSIKDRINALKILHKQGFYTYCFIAPVFPELTDVISIIKHVMNYVNEIWIDKLNLLDSNVKSVVYKYILVKHPELMNLYKSIYTDGDETYYKELNKSIKQFCKSNNIKFRKDVMSDYNCSKLTITSFI